MTTEDPSHPEPPPGWLHMRTAPKAGRYRVINPMTGPYTTEPKDGEWPMDGWGDTQGRFYPTPYGWLPLQEGMTRWAVHADRDRDEGPRAMTKLKQSEIDFMKLIMRSPDVGDGWRTITKNLWACIELHSRPELVESVQDETGGGRLRLTERGRIVFEYLT